MLVLSMNSKRQRRPNVRLGEIGDIPAAFACGFSRKIKENLGHKRHKIDFLSPNDAGQYTICGFAEQNTPEFVVLDPGVFSRVSVDLQQDTENNNPNSSKSAFESMSSDENGTTNPTLNFGPITRKCRVMKRRSRSSNVLGSVWSSMLSPRFVGDDAKDSSLKEIAGLTSEMCDDCYPLDGFNDFTYQDTSASSKGASEHDGEEEEAHEHDVYEPTYDVRRPENFNYSWLEEACYDRDNVSPACKPTWNEGKSGGNDVNTVSKWLEEQGFGKYAGLFEMHEVDEEALPLLTIEDLKEIGVSAVGPRRKLYTAIQQLGKKIMPT